MRAIVLLLGLIAGLARAQVPDCVISFSLVNAADRSTITGCGKNTQGVVDWRVIYASNGFSAVSVAVQSAPDVAGAPGTWVNWAGAVVSPGINPNTSITNATTEVTGFYPWVSVTLASKTGTGRIQGVLYGCRQPGCSTLATNAGGAVWGLITGMLSAQTDLAAALAAKQALLGFTPENVANKDVANGYAGLDASALLKMTECPTATTALKGCLSAADWTTFNGKQAALGYTPLNPANNLSDVAAVATARTNLGLGPAASLPAAPLPQQDLRSSATGPTTISTQWNAPGQIYSLAPQLPNTLAALNRLRTQQQGLFTVAYLGDSWVGFGGGGLANVLRDHAQGNFGNAGIGYITFTAAPAGVPSSVVLASSGTWTICNQTASCVGANAYNATSSGTATYTVTAPGVNYVLHYLQQASGGTITWSVDGGSGCGGTCTGTITTAGATLYSTSTLGPFTQAQHVIVFTAATNATVMGLDIQIPTTGVRVHSLGSTGATSQTFSQLSATTFEAGLVALAPDLVIYTIGTNDETGSVAPATMAANIATVIAEIQAALPNVDILLATPADPTGTLGTPMQQYVNAQVSLSTAAGVYPVVAVLDDNQYFGGSHAIAVTRGLMQPDSGDVHPTTVGVAAIVGNIMGFVSGQREKQSSGDQSMLDYHYFSAGKGNRRTWDDSTLGANQITSGATTSLGSGWSWTFPTLTATAPASGVAAQFTSVTYAPAHVYRVCAVVTVTSGQVRMQIASTNNVTSPVVLANFVQSNTAPGCFYGSIPFDWVNASNPALVFVVVSAFTGSITGITFQEAQGGDQVTNGNSFARNTWSAVANGSGTASGAVGSFLMATATSAGMFRVAVYYRTTVAGSAGSVYPQVVFNDGLGFGQDTFTAITCPLTLSGTSNAGNCGFQANFNSTFYVGQAQNANLQFVVGVAIVGSPTYAYWWTLERFGF